MNGIIALCHFCEMHGPSIMFLTQTFHDNAQPSDVLDNNGTPSKKKKPYYGKPIYMQKTNPNTPNTASPTSPKISDNCEACRCKSIGYPDLVCNDHEARVSYISSQYPYHSEIFSIVRQACVRSLSCEVCPGREGPIFFGDDSRGHVLSHTFFLKDSQARGFHRWYSIIIIMMDKIYLLNSWPFLVSQFKKIINLLQEKAIQVYENEQAKCSQRAVRLNAASETTPGNFRRQRGSTKIMRSLSELTDDDKLFPKLHYSFTWILRAGGNRLTEKLFEGLPTEDTVINWEKQEELDNGFIYENTSDFIPSYKESESSRPASDEDISVEDKNIQFVNNIRHICKFLGEKNFKIIAYHALIGNQLIVRSDNKLFVSSFINALKSLLPRGCYRPICYAYEYQDSWKCNFLGLPSNTHLPDHVQNSDLHICVDLLINNETIEGAATNPLNHSVNIISQSEIPSKLPQVLTKMCKSIEDAHISDRVLEFFFISLKEEWMNKVKVLFKFSRAGSRTKEDTRKLLTVLGALEQDKQLLKFWMTGLSTQYKTHILSATMQTTNLNS